MRLPGSANGIVGIRPTRGLLSRSAIIPLSLSFDTGGHSAAAFSMWLRRSRSFRVSIPPTKLPSFRREVPASYTTFLKAEALKGARIGIGRDFMGYDPDVDWAMESAIHAMKKAGATLVDVRFPAIFFPC